MSRAFAREQTPITYHSSPITHYLNMQGSKELRERLATACRLLYMEGLMDHAGLAGGR